MVLERFDPAVHDVDQVKAVLAPSVWGPTEEKLRALLREFYAGPGRELLVGRDGETVVGVMGIGHVGQGRAVIEHLAVAPEYRGQGLGRALVEQGGALLGLDEVEAETDSEAVGFYRACGFVVESLGEKYPGVERFRGVKKIRTRSSALNGASRV